VERWEMIRSLVLNLVASTPVFLKTYTQTLKYQRPQNMPRQKKPKSRNDANSNLTHENPRRATVGPSSSENLNLSQSKPSYHAESKQPTGQYKLSKPSINRPKPGLYIVATPIGNARDITLRALELLKECDVIACEDTRVTRKLLGLHGISAKLIPYHEHNAEKIRPSIIKRVQNGETVALVSDAGTPVISDPGLNLVQAFAYENLLVTSLPGPSATLTALVLSGLPSDRFLFGGFLPTKGGRRRSALKEVATTPATLIFLESAKRLAASLADMVTILGPRPAAVTRELTKIFEEVRRGPLDALANKYAAEGAPKGEITIVIGPPNPEKNMTAENVNDLLKVALENLSVRDATTEVTKATGWPKRNVYALALTLKKVAL
jgi:16S rRNA (cytidine1402-2'-O)-methyltransferase